MFNYSTNCLCPIHSSQLMAALPFSMRTSSYNNTVCPMVGHLFQNYDTIYVRFFPTYTCNHSCYTIYVRFFATYTCVLSFYICAQKSPYICVTNKHVVYGVTESPRIRGTQLYRQQKTPSCRMELKSNFSLNQAWPQ